MAEKDRGAFSSEVNEKCEEIVLITDVFCHTYLNEEYKELCRKMTVELGRKQDFPLQGGQSQSWAAGILYTLGKINYLFDKSSEPYVSVARICAEVGVSKATVARKAREIKSLLNISPLATEWYLPGRLKDSPLPWLISINGLIIDARTLPREMQEDAYKLGLIPYLP
jgi:hypothetical protein